MSFASPSGLDHQTRAFLALAIGLRYEAEPDSSVLAPARALLDAPAQARAATLGAALRLAYVLSAGTPALLAETALRLEPGRLILRLRGSGVFEGEGVQRRLDHLAATLGMAAVLE